VLRQDDWPVFLGKLPTRLTLHKSYATECLPYLRVNRLIKSVLGTKVVGRWKLLLGFLPLNFNWSQVRLWLATQGAVNRLKRECVIIDRRDYVCG